MECSVEKTGMDYEGNIIRPPSEAFSIILQATVGCSHNKCTFCGTYTGERFKIKDDQTILEGLAFAAKYMKRQDRLFICDGDGLIITPEKAGLAFGKNQGDAALGQTGGALRQHQVH